jgi:Ankyrin repeats (3 copies)
VELLLRNGAELEAEDEFGKTALHVAARNGYEAVVDLLLQAEANIEAEEYCWETPLTCAIESRSESLIGLLLARGAKVDHRYTPEMTCLMCFVPLE